MMLSKEEKEYLKSLVLKDFEHFKREKKTLLVDLPVRFLKGEHELEHFFNELVKKLGD